MTGDASVELGAVHEVHKAPDAHHVGSTWPLGAGTQLRNTAFHWVEIGVRLLELPSTGITRVLKLAT
jgi:hypothetical protein